MVRLPRDLVTSYSGQSPLIPTIDSLEAVRVATIRTPTARRVNISKSKLFAIGNSCAYMIIDSGRRCEEEEGSKYQAAAIHDTGRLSSPCTVHMAARC